MLVGARVEAQPQVGHARDGEHLAAVQHVADKEQGQRHWQVDDVERDVASKAQQRLGDAVVFVHGRLSDVESEVNAVLDEHAPEEEHG